MNRAEDFRKAEMKAEQQVKLYFAKHTEYYKLGMKHIYEVLNSLESAEEKIEYLKRELLNIIKEKSEIRQYIDQKIPLEDQMNNYFPTEDAIKEMESNIYTLLSEQERIFELENKNEGNVNHSTRRKLTWNGQNNVIIDIFKQAKKKLNKEGKPLIPNSNDEIAVFLKESFDCFENTKIETIKTQLNREERPKKSENLIDLI